MKKKILLSLSCVGLLASCGPTIGASSSGEATVLPPASSSSSADSDPSSGGAASSIETDPSKQAEKILEGNYLRTKINAESLDFNVAMQAVGTNEADQTLYLADDHVSVDLDNFVLDATVNNEHETFEDVEMAFKTSGVFAESHTLDVPPFDPSIIMDLLGGGSSVEEEEEPEQLGRYMDVDDPAPIAEPEEEEEEEQKTYVHIENEIDATAFSAEAYLKEGVAYLNLKDKGFWSVLDYFVADIDGWIGADLISTVLGLVSTLLKMNPAYVDMKQLFTVEEGETNPIDDAIASLPSLDLSSIYDFLDDYEDVVKDADGYHYTINIEKADVVNALSGLAGDNEMMQETVAQISANLKMRKCTFVVNLVDGMLDLDFDVDVEAKFPGTYNPLIADYELKGQEEIKPMEFSAVAKGDIQFTAPESVEWPQTLGESYGNDLTETIKALIDSFSGN